MGAAVVVTALVVSALGSGASVVAAGSELGGLAGGGFVDVDVDCESPLATSVGCALPQPVDAITRTKKPASAERVESAFIGPNRIVRSSRRATRDSFGVPAARLPKTVGCR